MIKKANEFVLKDLSDLKNGAFWLLKMTETFSHLAFYGEMGAGKTTIIQELCRISGVRQEVTSPTFALVNEYTTEKGQIIYHFDFFRLDEPGEALEIGFEDYISSGNRCFMEWPEKIEPLLPEDTLRVYINPTGEKSRILRIQYPA